MGRASAAAAGRSCARSTRASPRPRNLSETRRSAMALPSGLKLGALGGPNTFGGQAAQRMRELYPEFAEILYFRTAEESMDGEPPPADAACAPEQMRWTGSHPGIHGRVSGPDSRTYVIAEVTHYYHASLLAKPGTRPEQIRE